jgi:OOP family OmpA-OmpF porin
MKSLFAKCSMLLSVVALSGCAEMSISELENTKREGFEFSTELSKEYEMFAKKQSREYNDQIDGQHFAVKGIQAASGLEVLPEDPRDWNVSEEDLGKLLDARSRLLMTIHKSGRNINPTLAAKTQVLFDCWVEESEDDPANAGFCRDGFHKSIVALETAVYKDAPIFKVMFGYEQAALTKEAETVLEDAVKIAKNLDKHRITLIGHTDGAGSRKSNLMLSQKRAEAVKDALIKMGIAHNRIFFVGGGELDTGKHVDPLARRVDIHIS